MTDNPKRSILKTLSWRLFATLTTISIVFIFTGKVSLAFEVGGVEVVAKLILYYLHERGWDHVGWGKEKYEKFSLKNVHVKRNVDVEKSAYHMHYLKQLEAESIHIIREAAAEAKNPVMLYSIGKDSSVLLKLIEKAFYPGKIPFPLLHIDTGYKFKEMIEFRDYYVDKIGANLIVHKNESDEAKQFTGDQAHTDQYIYHKKTKPLLDAIREHGFDLAFGGARRDEEKARAKERVFSFRDKNSVWDPKNQRPELWNLYNARINDGESIRCFPLSNWTEMDVWMYIKEENIEIVPLYYSQKMNVVRRHGVILRVDEHVQPKEGEVVEEVVCRYRTLGCAPSTGAVISDSVDLDGIIKEVVAATNSERQNRAIDHGSESSMEEKKKEGYF